MPDHLFTKNSQPKKRKKKRGEKYVVQENAQLTNHRPRLLRFPPLPSRLFLLKHSLDLFAFTHFCDHQVSILIKFRSLSRVSLPWG